MAAQCEIAIPPNLWGGTPLDFLLRQDIVVAQSFSVRWTGSVPLQGGAYVFVVEAANGGVQLLLDQFTILNAYYGCNEERKSDKVSLAIGVHNISFVANYVS